MATQNSRKQSSSTVTGRERARGSDGPKSVVPAKCGSSGQACPCRRHSNAPKAVRQGKHPPPAFPRALLTGQAQTDGTALAGVAFPGYWARAGTGRSR